tara:strand:- start:1852 stop:2319 length:468 start_codon:yes stop_codon:yes gene_type:complete
MGRYNSRNTVVTLSDSDGSNTATLGPGEGNLTISDSNNGNTEKIRVMNRGVFDGFVVGDDLQQDWSITIQVENQSVTSGVAERVWDMIHKSGSKASANSTSADIWAFKLIATMDDGTTTSTITLPVCQAAMSFAEGKESHSFTISGTNNGAVVVT